MLVDTENLVTRDELLSDLDRYVEAAAAGNGPVAVTQDSRIIGFLFSPAEYESLHGGAVSRLLKSRMTGETVSHEFVRKKVVETLLLRPATDSTGSSRTRCG